MKQHVEKIPWYLSWKGLLFATRPKPILLHTHFGIHTFFLQFPIDVVIVSEENKIVAIKQNLKPFHVFFWNPIYRKVVELPVGTVEKQNLRLGQIYNA